MIYRTRGVSETCKHFVFDFRLALNFVGFFSLFLTSSACKTYSVRRAITATNEIPRKSRRSGRIFFYTHMYYHLLSLYSFSPCTIVFNGSRHFCICPWPKIYVHVERAVVLNIFITKINRCRSCNAVTSRKRDSFFGKPFIALGPRSYFYRDRI